ncbi:uncharacterized protein LOC142634705 [Castanea sativa]|uniref:uncharacterized protein LOC142634705 n=1 Tax=Castanea sativa TaxID=21020 RepID=UPI003F652D97
MQKLGFPEKWIERVMTCVTTTAFSILLNGYGNVTPSRGIHQGDPLSLYLFLLCAKGFTSLLAKAKSNGKIHGASICRGAPKISNLLFVDDSILFCRATQNEVEVGNERKIHWQRWEKLMLSKREGGMGFRDLRAFNLAMLAKQGWRLLHDNNSLVFECLKARYFPRTHLFDAKESSNCSFVWKSIVAAFPIMKSGCCWRVGNGHSIQILGDKWIPNHPTNAHLHIIKDKVAKEVLRGGWVAESSRGCIGKGVWPKLWKLRIPNKIKVFGWRACNEILPTKLNLSKRRVIEDAMCPICLRFSKSVVHALWECDAARDVWASQDMEVVLVQAWLIWNQRNQVVHGGKFHDLGWLTNQAREFLEEFRITSALMGPVHGGQSNRDTCSSFGAVNEKGEVMAAMAAKGPEVFCSEEVELLACRKAMNLL